MNLRQRKKIVLLGMMSRLPVAGVVWQTLHYLVGFQRLGYDVYYVEAHRGAPMMLMQREDDDGSAKAAAFIAAVMRRFDLGDRWAFHALHADGRYYGMSESRLKQLYRSAALIINLHGGTQPLPEHSATDRLVYLETDPVAPQIELHHNVQYTLDFLEPHCAFFTFGENYGNADCELPVSDRFNFLPTRQPVMIDFWQPYSSGVGHTFSTVGSWRQLGRDVTFRGETYQWSKHYEFMKFLELPTLTGQAFELALNRYDEADERMLEDNGWRVRDALSFSTDADAYRRYIARSRGEFTVAKDQNVRLRSGWFSDRSATYLAAGRPVVTQETGFSNILPTGRGLFAFADMDEAVQALESINSDYGRHRRAASALAREYFSYDVVLPRLLADVGLPCSPDKARVDKVKTSEVEADQHLENVEENLVGTTPFPPELALTPTSRCPTTLSDATVKTVLANSAPISPARFDLLCLPIVEQSSCSRRLQQLMAQFARYGHRVFHLKPSYVSLANSLEGVRTRASATNLFEVLVSPELFPASSDRMTDDQEGTLLQVLRTLRHTHEIETAVTYVQDLSWGSVAMRARERWGWKVVYDCVDAKDFRLDEGWPIKYKQTLQRQSDAVIVGSETVATREQNSGRVGRRAGWLRQHTQIESDNHIATSIVAAYKPASIVVVTYNNLVFTKLCLGSVVANTEYPNHEIIVVDNGSTDGTPAYLQSLMQRHSHIRVVLNADNLGFARANNQGLALATGDVSVLLNNDTLVPRGWLTRLVRHLENPGVGLVGPVTNRIGNEAQVDVPYHTYGGFVRFARDHLRRHEGQLFDVTTLMMFCVAMRRDFYERIGSLDERFEVGTFEDDDYAMRVRSAGYRVVVAEDVFVHHFGEASFGKLMPTGEYGKLFQANRRRFEEKWGTRWETHRHRLSERYMRLIRRVRKVVDAALPSDATVVVVSRGDDELLRLDGKRAWHFPQTEDGTYAGHYPAGDAEAIAHLEALRAKGAEFLLFPATAFWWLEHYPEFGRHLERRYREVARREDACIVFDLREPGTDQTGMIAQRGKDARAFLRREVPE